MDRNTDELTLSDLEIIEPVATIPEEPKQLIVLEQLPVIRQQLELRSAEIKKDIDFALAQVCTDESIVIVKKLRAKLTSGKTEIETQRKKALADSMIPWDQFMEIYKELILDPYTEADAKLKAKIDALETEKKNEKEKGAMRYFAELCAAEKIDFITFENVGLNITLTVTERALGKQIKEFIDRVVSDVALIDTQDFKTEIMVEYKRSLNCSKAITDVAGRHKALEEEKQRQIEREAARTAQNARVAQIDTFIPPPIQAPRIEPQAVTAPLQTIGKECFATFKAYGTIEVLKGLKAYLVANNIRFENVSATVITTVASSPDKSVPSVSVTFKGTNEKDEPVEQTVLIPKSELKTKEVLPVAFVTFKSKEGVYGGRAYSYVIPEGVAAEVVEGSFVDVATKHGIVSGLVERVGSTADVAAEIIPKLMKLEGITKEEGDK